MFALNPIAAQKPKRTPAIVRCATFLPLLLPVCQLLAAEYFVATDGSDGNPGTRSQPFASIQRAQNNAAPGDTVFIRGGSYSMSEDQIAKKTRLYAYASHLDKSGRPGARINYWAYPGEHPVFDLSGVKPAGLRVAAFYVPASWIHFKGLDETQLTQLRQADGSLPNLSFMHLAPGSGLLDKGVNIGAPFKGLAPDPGAFEK